MTKTDLNYPAISLGFVDFEVQFYFHYKFSLQEKRRSSQVGVIFPGQSQSFATHSNQFFIFYLFILPHHKYNENSKRKNIKNGFNNGEETQRKLWSLY